MSWLLVVRPDSAQADTLREALGAHIRDARVVVAESLDDALLAIDQDIPDILLLPTLIPAAEEDYLISYLGTLPGARHVQILGLPRLQRPDDSVRPQARSLFAWRRRKGSDIGGTPGCDPDVFSQDVLAYLAGARALKQEIEFYSAHGASSGPDVAVSPDTRLTRCRGFHLRVLEASKPS